MECDGEPDRGASAYREPSTSPWTGTLGRRSVLRTGVGVVALGVGLGGAGRARSTGGGSGPDSRTVTITADVPVEYALSVDGTLEPDTEGGQFSGEESDAPTRLSGGRWTVNDSTGPHPTNTDGRTYYGDRYFVTGPITGLAVTPESPSYDVNLYVDERQVTASEAREFTEPGETHTFMLTANGPTQYRLTVDGALEPDTEGGQFSGEDDDTPTRDSDGVWTVSDSTGPNVSNMDGRTYDGDRYLFTGTVVGLDLSTPERPGDVNLYLDEAQVSRAELVGTAT